MPSPPTHCLHLGLSHPHALSSNRDHSHVSASAMPAALRSSARKVQRSKPLPACLFPSGDLDGIPHAAMLTRGIGGIENFFLFMEHTQTASYRDKRQKPRESRKLLSRRILTATIGGRLGSEGPGTKKMPLDFPRRLAETHLNDDIVFMQTRWDLEPRNSRSRLLTVSMPCGIVMNNRICLRNKTAPKTPQRTGSCCQERGIYVSSGPRVAVMAS